MGVVFQKTKHGTVYVYSNEPYWDKEKQQSRAKRKLLGKLDPATGELVPTRPYRKKESAPSLSAKPGPQAIVTTRRCYYGATYLFDQIGRITGVEEDLKACFPDCYKKLLSIAYFLILEENNSLSRFPHWHRLHIHPYKEDISSQRSSELFQSLEESDRVLFFRKQGKRRLDKEFWAFDVTSISSYSEMLKQVKNGRNKENDRLPQINLGLLFGEQSGLPFYYRKLPGNITDVKTIKQLMAEFEVMEYNKVKIVLDRGFYSRENVNELFKARQKFIIGVKLGLKYVKQILDEERENLKKWPYFQPQFGVYGLCRTISWDYEQERPYKKDVLREKRRAYLLLYYSPEKAATDQMDFNARLTRLRKDLEEGTERAYLATDYNKYFEVKVTPKRGKRVIPREEIIEAELSNCGYFAFLSNEVKDPFMALSLYRSKDITEKAFGNLKERLGFRRMQVSSDLSLDGKLFVEFIALIYLSYVKKIMQDKKLFETWTLQGLLDELDVIELFESPDYGRILGEITTKQSGIYEAFEIAAPSL